MLDNTAILAVLPGEWEKNGVAVFLMSFFLM